MSAAHTTIAGTAARALLVLAMMWPAAPAKAQTVAIEPEALRRIPDEDVGGGRYWQQLVVTFRFNDAASDETVSLELPAGGRIPDDNQDGRIADEVRLVYVPADDETPQFFVAETTSAGRVVVGSQAPTAPGGQLYLQFAAIHGENSEADTSRYGPVVFADPRSADLEVGPELAVVRRGEFNRLGSMDVVRFAAALQNPTTTGAQGETFPELDEFLVEPLPDLVFDGGVAADGDGDDGNDVLYRFFFSPEPALQQVDEQTATPALTLDGEPYTETEAGRRRLRLLTRHLPAGPHYLYVVAPQTGGLPLGRSQAVVVRHEPRVLQVDPQETDITLDSGGLLDAAGEPTQRAQTAVPLGYRVVDIDDSLTVHLFYSDRSDLEGASIQLDNGAVRGLAGAQPLTPPEGIAQDAGPFLWDILDPVAVPAGDYYIYAVASDGKAADVWRSLSQIRVRHAPSLRLDPLDDRIVAGADTIVTGGQRPQRHVTLTWGRSGPDGDEDLDDDARIDLFYSPIAAGGEQGWAVPGGELAFLQAVGHSVFPIASDLPEDPDGRAADRYIWDLSSLAGQPEAVPEEGRVHYVYGLIRDGTTARLTQMNGGRPNDAGSRVVFVHPPSLRPLQPLATITLGAGGKGRAAWEDFDLDDDARIRVMLCPEDVGPVSDYAALAEGGAYVLNSADGSALAAVDPVFDISEDSPIDHFDLDLRHLQRGIEADGPPSPGEYALYYAIEDGSQFGAESLAWRAPGGIRVEAAEGAGDEAFSLLPQVFAVGALGGIQNFEIRVDAGQQEVDLVQVTLRVDGARFAAVDQDTVRAGIQPFAAAPGFEAAKLVDSRVELGEEFLLLHMAYLEPTAATIPGLDGTRPLAVLQLAALDAEGEAAVEWVADASLGGTTQLLNDGQAVLASQGGVAASGVVVAGRARATGTLLMEGRAAVPTRVDVALRPWASYAPVEDSLFAVTNDLDPERAGVQIELDPDGAFALEQLPSGRLDLFFHRDGYLDAWVRGLDLLPAVQLQDLRPETPLGQGRMLGGDVAGWLDAAGQVRPDNEVTLADWDYVAAFFGAPLAEQEEGVRADITGDGAVDVQDLALVGANFLRSGPRPVYKVPEAASQMRLDVAYEPAGDTGKARLTVTGQGLAAVRAYQLEFELDTGGWSLGAMRGPAGLLQAGGFKGGRLRYAASLKGSGGRVADGVLLEIDLEPAGPQVAPPVLTVSRLVDAGFKSLPHRRAAPAAIPNTTALLQNHPNPFNPATVIGLRLARPWPQARVDVFNAVGQQVAVLWEGPLAAGQHRLRWDGRDAQGQAVGSGVYFYRLYGPEGRYVRPMVLVR